MTKLILPYHVQQGTLAYYKAQPLFKASSMAHVRVKQAAAVAREYLKTCGMRQPESEAVTFYTGNAIFAELLKKFAPEETLPQWADELARTYVSLSSKAAQRLAIYLLLIITRESRHVHGNIFPEMEKKHGMMYQKFNSGLHGHGSMEAKDYFVANAPDMSLGDYARAISWTFNYQNSETQHKNFGGSFGGYKWGVIADVFKEMVEGKLSPEMVTDVSWALCHNGGPIFNKGMSYKHYDHADIIRILDVQRSGQMCEFVHAGGEPTSAHAIDMVQVFRANMPGVFGDKVDWVKVMAAGAEGSYSHLIVKPVEVPKPAPEPVVKPSNLYYVTPNKYVLKFNKVRKEAA